MATFPPPVPGSDGGGGADAGKYGPDFLREHIEHTLRFYDGAVDDVLGGFHNQLLDDGVVYDSMTKHVVGTCRFVVNYSFAERLRLPPPRRGPGHAQRCAHGVRFLMERHADAAHGGFTWVLDGWLVRDATKQCYAAAFAVLALANAAAAGVAGARAHLAAALVLAERYYEPRHGMYVDAYDRAFSAAAPYRGQNANMHMAEALIAAYEVTGDRALLARAAAVCRRLCHDVPRGGGWEHRVCEHYTSDWAPDPGRNKGIDRASEEYIFRPHGFQPGHSMEWAKLILVMERLGGSEAWMLPCAEGLFAAAVRHGWDGARGGLCYTFGADGGVLDSDKYYWAEAEMIAAAGLLALRTGKGGYWRWYAAAWDHALRHFVDTERGGWYPMLSGDNVRVDRHAPKGHRGAAVKSYPSKTDYHPVAACWELLRAHAAAAAAAGPGDPRAAATARL